MTYEEIQTELYALKSALDEKTSEASAQFTATSYGRPTFSLYGKAGLLGKHGVERFMSDSVAEALSAAWQRISDLPSIEDQGVAIFRTKLASAISEATDSGVDSDILDGARQSLKAASEALLPKPTRRTMK